MALAGPLRKSSADMPTARAAARTSSLCCTASAGIWADTRAMASRISAGPLIIFRLTRTGPGPVLLKSAERWSASGLALASRGAPSSPFCWRMNCSKLALASGVIVTVSVSGAGVERGALPVSSPLGQPDFSKAAWVSGVVAQGSSDSISATPVPDSGLAGVFSDGTASAPGVRTVFSAACAGAPGAASAAAPSVAPPAAAVPPSAAAAAPAGSPVPSAPLIASLAATAARMAPCTMTPMPAISSPDLRWSVRLPSSSGLDFSQPVRKLGACSSMTLDRRLPSGRPPVAPDVKSASVSPASPPPAALAIPPRPIRKRVPARTILPVTVSAPPVVGNWNTSVLPAAWAVRNSSADITDGSHLPLLSNSCM